eukprot:35006_1
MALQKKVYNEIMTVNDGNMQVAKVNHNKVESWINSIAPKYRKPYKDSSFINTNLPKLERKIYGFVMATLKDSNLPANYQAAVASKVKKLVTDFNVNSKIFPSDKIYYVDLSDEWGGDSDVFACVYTLVPDPDEKDDYYFFFGYYGEHWIEEEDVMINKNIWTEETVQGWLSYLLWKSCIDKIKALTI